MAINVHDTLNPFPSYFTHSPLYHHPFIPFLPLSICVALFHPPKTSSTPIDIWNPLGTRYSSIQSLKLYSIYLCLLFPNEFIYIFFFFLPRLVGSKERKKTDPFEREKNVFLQQIFHKIFTQCTYIKKLTKI